MRPIKLLGAAAAPPAAGQFAHTHDCPTCPRGRRVWFDIAQQQRQTRQLCHIELPFQAALNEAAVQIGLMQDVWLTARRHACAVHAARKACTPGMHLA